VRVLLDTCVLSELRRPRGQPGVRAAVYGLADEDLFVSVLSVGEITQGTELLREGAQRRALEAWLATLEAHYADRLLAIDAEICRVWGEITAAAQKRGRTLHAIDGLIAATAVRHGLHVMTRNTADFAPSGVLLINPWDR
jgi:toxin FitB